ncbi:hypothetical protein TNCT_79801 [Trichonephila clavata]|uniref:Uncharacterized protein n=1 Tax=Trichonephila clavata TaxID=2740835 RepID=A0A8X6JKV5_TRICU|nr:hypothetical protein TNCT_79801 [Trichonephila clavata]
MTFLTADELFHTQKVDAHHSEQINLHRVEEVQSSPEPVAASRCIDFGPGALFLTTRPGIQPVESGRPEAGARLFLAEEHRSFPK